MTAAIEAKIKAAADKLAKLKADKRKAEARLRSAESKAKRATDTRRKILLGAYLLERMSKDEASKAKVMTGLDAYLTEARDRALFDLQPKPVTGS
jgi:septal ring factor EnvC (AmiA/AmiB activator)